MRVVDIPRPAIVAFAVTAGHAAEPQPVLGVSAYTMNYRNADLQVIVDALAQDMGKVIRVDQIARTRITWVKEKLSPAELYNDFVRVLKEHDLSVREADGVVTIISAPTTAK